MSVSVLDSDAKRDVLNAAERAWPGVWHAHDAGDGKITLVGQFSHTVLYEQGTSELIFSIEGKKLSHFCTLLLHFLNGGS